MRSSIMYIHFCQTSSLLHTKCIWYQLFLNTQTWQKVPKHNNLIQFVTKEQKLFIKLKNSPVFTKSCWSSVNDEIFYICLMFGSILLVILTSFSMGFETFQPYSWLKSLTLCKNAQCWFQKCWSICLMLWKTFCENRNTL